MSSFLRGGSWPRLGESMCVVLKQSSEETSGARTEARVQKSSLELPFQKP